jgi:hypothetical protein
LLIYNLAAYPIFPGLHHDVNIPQLLAEVDPKLSYLTLFFQGFITMATFRSILAEVDPKLSDAELDGIIAEIDEDGSGTMDFEEFCELMMTSPEDND